MFLRTYQLLTTSISGQDDSGADLLAVVGIPVCNERDHIVDCLRALDAQRPVVGRRLGVLLFLNNCVDGTADAVAAAMPGIACRVQVVERTFEGASAGWARRCAMEAAASWLTEEGDGDGALLTTDADSRVPSDWLSRNLAALAAGADAVAGCLALDPLDAARLPPALHARGALEARYEALLTEIVARLDPPPGNPWPHHWCRSGASLAVRLSTYRAVGGMPDIPLGEDRAFVQAVLAHDGIVRHDPDLVVVTSGRLEGRAKGGVADTIRLRCEAPDSVCDDRLERLERVVARASLRRHLRALHAAGRRDALRRWARVLGLGGSEAVALAANAHFGAFHIGLEAAAARLRYQPLRPAGLPRQIGRAGALVRAIRALAPDQAPATASRGGKSAVTPAVADLL